MITVTSGGGVLVEAEHEMRKLSPRDAYIGFCLRLDCKPILAVADLFSGVAGDWSSNAVIDLSATYVGPRGIVAICDACKLLTGLRHLDFSSNFLTNECGPSIAELVCAHPSLESLELKGNRYLSWTTAMYLVKALTENSRITYIGLLGTSVDNETRDSLFALTRQNAVSRFVKRAPLMRPSDHQNAVQLRAMRHYFLSLADESGTVPLSRVSDGRRERRRFQGLVPEDPSHAAVAGVDSDEELDGNASGNGADGPRITWNQFLVLVMLDGTVYDDQLVRHLEEAFERFNVLPTEGRTGGVVEVREFPHILSALYALPPRSHDVAALREKLGLDETMIVTWDEFLYTFYHRPSDMNAGVTGCVATPLPDQTRAFHY